jgi:hypothetical protein
LAAVVRSGCVVRVSFTDTSSLYPDTSTGARRFLVERAAGDSTTFDVLGWTPYAAPLERGGRVTFDDPAAECGKTYRYAARREDPFNGLSGRSQPVVVDTFALPAGGVGAAYFNDRSFSDPPDVRDAALPLDSLERLYGPASPDSRIEADTFSAVFSGMLRAELNETYTFYTASDDGIALRLVDPRDGRVLIDFDNLSAERQMPDSGFQDTVGTATLERGVQYRLEVRYSEDTGEAGFRVGWASPSTPLEVIPGALLTPVTPGAGPTVAGVYLSGSEWPEEFRQRLASQATGSDAYGLPLASGGAGSDGDAVLPWAGMNRFTVAFDRGVKVGRDDLRVFAPGGGQYPVAEFFQAPGSGLATWTLARPLEAGRIAVELPAERAGSGGSRITLSVLPGDATRSGAVNALDLGDVKRRLNTTAGGGGSVVGPGYSPFADVNSDGRINALDLALVKQRLNTRLPAAGPTPLAVSALLAVDPITRDLFSSAPVLP